MLVALNSTTLSQMKFLTSRQTKISFGNTSVTSAQSEPIHKYQLPYPDAKFKYALPYPNGDINSFVRSIVEGEKIATRDVGGDHANYFSVEPMTPHSHFRSLFITPSEGKKRNGDLKPIEVSVTFPKERENKYPDGSTTVMIDPHTAWVSRYRNMDGKRSRNLDSKTRGAVIELVTDLFKSAGQLFPLPRVSRQRK